MLISIAKFNVFIFLCNRSFIVFNFLFYIFLLNKFYELTVFILFNSFWYYLILLDHQNNFFLAMLIFYNSFQQNYFLVYIQQNFRSFRRIVLFVCFRQQISIDLSSIETKYESNQLIIDYKRIKKIRSKFSLVTGFFAVLFYICCRRFIM